METVPGQSANTAAGENSNIQRIEIIHAISGNFVMEIKTRVEVDVAANSAFMVAVLILVAKEPNIPRAWLSLLPPQDKVAPSIRLPILMEVPSEETMEWLWTQEDTCVICGDPCDPRRYALYDDYACMECRPCCLCRSCHVVVAIDEIRVHTYCLACFPGDMVADLDEPHRTRLQALSQYWSR